MNHKKYVIYYASFFCIFFLNSTLLAKPIINWTPKKISVENVQGTLSTHTVKARISKDTENVVARVVPALQKWVTVSPNTFGNLQKGQVIDMTISINLPSDAAIGSFDGVIQLRSAIGGKSNKTLAKPLPIKLTITEFDFSGLPPDPGEAGRLTLLGIDSDNDGVRDDIQRYIHSSYPDDEKTKLALIEVSKQFQILLDTTNDSNAVFRNATKMARHGECLDYIKNEQAGDILSALLAETLNTTERSIQYIKFNDNIGGSVILGRPLSEWKNSCSFDVDAVGGAQ